MHWEIRAARNDDAAGISSVIVAALRITNARDYSAAVIEQVEKSFGSAAVAELIRKRKVYVALLEGSIVGTASLDGSVVRTVFVAPHLHGHGIGRSLMNKVEEEARHAGVETLVVPSSVTAEAFYSRLGFKAVRDSFHGEELTIIMERQLSESLNGA